MRLLRQGRDEDSPGSTCPFAVSATRAIESSFPLISGSISSLGTFREERARSCVRAADKAA